MIQSDIEGLIEAGAPPDEYADEAAQLAAVIELMSPDDRSAESILAALSLIWVHSFDLTQDDMELRLPALRQVSEKLLSNL